MASDNTSGDDIDPEQRTAIKSRGRVETTLVGFLKKSNGVPTSTMTLDGTMTTNGPTIRRTLGSGLTSPSTEDG